MLEQQGSRAELDISRGSLQADGNGPVYIRREWSI